MARIEGDDNYNLLQGGAASDRVFGYGGRDTLEGFPGGDDLLDGGAGDDSINAYGRGDMTVRGGDGDDVIQGGPDGGDLMDGGAGNDLFVMEYSSDPDADRGSDTVAGGAGFDELIVRMSGASETVLSLSGEVSVNGVVRATVSGVEAVTFQSTDGAQNVTGTDADDYILTDGDFADTLFGGLGDDTLIAGGGRDRIEAGRGDDEVSLGDGGGDKVDLGAGDDSLDVQIRSGEASGIARYEGGDGDDELHVNLTSDLLRGVAFDGRTLTLDGAVIAEVSGFESVSLEGTRLVGLAGDDALSGTYGAEVSDRLVGRGGDDSLDGYTGRNVLIGGAGDDNLEVELDGRADKLDGGAGEDRLEFDNVDASIVMTGDLQTGVTVTYGGETAVLGKRFESLEALGSEGDDVLLGGAGDDYVGVGEGGDVLSTFGGDDRVFVTLDDLADQIDLGDGTDVATLTPERNEAVVMREGAGGITVTLGGALAATISGAESFVVTTGDEDDRLLGGASTDALSAGAGRNVLNGRGGDDVLAVALDGSLDVVDGGAGVDRLVVDIADGFEAPLVTRIGDDGAITITVAGEVVLEARSVEAIYLNDTDGDDRLVGLALDDVLKGRFGVDTLVGGAGDDLLFASRDGAVLQGGAGSDTASFEERSGGVEVTLVAGETVTASYGFGTEATLASVENVIGTRFSDTIRGDSGDNVIDGGEGTDVLEGGAGIDTLSYASEDDGVVIDLVDGTAATELVAGAYVWIDRIGGFENVVGSSGSDRITGDDGANRIEGGRTGDFLTGGGGADTFVFAAGDTGSRFFPYDLVTDFSGAEGDRIDLSAMTEAAGGALSFVGDAAFSGAAGEVRFSGYGNGIELLIDLDGDARADDAIRLNGVTDIARDDLILS